MQKKMKNNEWNIPSDYFEKNKKALMPVRKFPTGKWLLALAAACVIGVGFFMLKGRTEKNEVAKVQVENQNEKQNENGKEGKIGEDIGAKYLSPQKGNLSPEKKNLSPKDEIAKELKEIPREELVAYLLEEDSDLIENIN
jgi:hypothetical protein